MNERVSVICQVASITTPREAPASPPDGERDDRAINLGAFNARVPPWTWTRISLERR